MKPHLILTTFLALLAGLATSLLILARDAVLTAETTANRTMSRAFYCTHPILGIGRLVYLKLDVSAWSAGIPHAEQSRAPALLRCRERAGPHPHIGVANQRPNQATRLDRRRGLIRTYTKDTAPDWIADDGRAVWVTNSVFHTASQLDYIGQPLGVYLLGNSSRGVCFAGSAMWIANKPSNHLLRG